MASPVAVGPSVAQPTHHVALTDGTHTIGLILRDNYGNARPDALTRTPIPRTAMKTSSGENKYSDFEPPWTPIAQDKWNGGMGMLDYDLDVTRYYDGYRVNTDREHIIMGPQEQYGTGYRTVMEDLPGDMDWFDLDGPSHFARSFTATASFTGTGLSVHIRRVGTPVTGLTIALCEDDGGVPGAVLKSETIAVSAVDLVSEFRRITFSQAITDESVYWIVCSAAGGNDDNYWQIGCYSSTDAGRKSSNGEDWITIDNCLYYRLVDNTPDDEVKSFIYKGGLYVLFNREGAAPRLYINGDRGVADSNAGALGTLVDASKSWETDEFAGCVVRLVGGVGATESTNWRRIVSNTADTLAVTPAWKIAHTTTTEYVIRGSRKWRIVSGHGLTAPVTSTHPINNLVYLAQGNAVNIRRMRWYQNSGSEAYQYADDSTNKADILASVRQTDGLKIWRALNSTLELTKADMQDWGTDLTFAGAIPLKDEYGLFTNLIEYGDTVKQLWIMREGIVYRILSDNTDEWPDKIPLEEMYTLMESTNGRAAGLHGVYLFFNLGSGLERYYDKQLDDVGPNRDDGLPTNRTGYVSAFLGYPGKYIITMDGGDENYSSIMVHNGSGYCEYYRAPMPGMRIGNLFYEVIPGSTPDKLWFNQGGDLVSLSFPSMTVDPYRDPYYPYTHESVITLGYMYGGLLDVWKYYHSLKLFTEKLAAGVVTIHADYQIDSSDTWVPLPKAFDTSPVEEIKIAGEDAGITCKRMRFRLRIQTKNRYISPKIKGLVTEMISRVQIKYAFTMPYRNYTEDVNLLGEVEDDSDMATRQYWLDHWAETLTPVTMQHKDPLFHGAIGFIDPSPLRPSADTELNYAGTIVFNGL